MVMRNGVKRPKTADLVLHDDPLARQQAEEKASARSRMGRPVQREGGM